MFSWKRNSVVWIWSPLLIIQFIMFLFLYNHGGYLSLRIIGWLIWLLSMIFGLYPIIILTKKGGVEEGKSYVHTTKIVDTGLYSIVRHPQYIAGILFGTGLALISQHWAIIMVGIFMIVFLYIDILMDDRYQVEKFGAEYKTYMQKVPRTNFILGCIKLIRSINN